MARVVHFEIPADDPERAAGFYRELFGWQIQDAGMPGAAYLLATTGEEGEPGIDGAITDRGTLTGVANTVQVASIRETLDRAKNMGGEVLTDVQEIPGVGQFAYCRDLDGNVFGVLQPEG